MTFLWKMNTSVIKHHIQLTKILAKNMQCKVAEIQLTLILQTFD